ncbi:MAG TPA: LuxR C-terminal-related transcriptional regulator, partial [Gaiellaceae bacterium]|nr:LuxR C-terminal-related transcriptional regulator [Gaiellaceae bacterium]
VVRRREEGAGAPLGLDRALPEARFLTARIAGLEPEDLGRLLDARLGMRISRRTLARLHRVSRGNPYFALEIGRALAAQDARDGPEGELPIPSSLQELAGERLAILPPSALEATRFAAALSRPTVGLVEAALDGGDAADAVHAAARAGVLELDGDRIRFAHPLLASVAYAQIPLGVRRAMHARLARVLADPEEHGRHLALATDHADAGVAAALDRAGRRALARGAPDAAAELWEQGRRLTPPSDGDDARRRGIEAAKRHFEAGATARSRNLLEEIAAGSPSGRERAQALAPLGWVRAHLEGFGAGAEVFRAALAEESDDLGLRIQLEEGLAWCLHESAGVPAAESHARSALALAERLGEPATLAGALSHVAFLESLKGEGVALATVERAVGLLEQAPEWSQILGRPDWVHALLLEWSGELAAAQERLESLYRAAAERGDLHSLPFVLFHLARVELLTGDWRSALSHARECHETTLQSGQVGEIAYGLAIEALVESHLGLVEPASAKIEEGLAVARQRGAEPAGLELLGIRGFLALSNGDAAVADRVLTELAAAAVGTGLREPALFRFHGDAVEAKVLLGRRDEAARLADELDRLGAKLDRPWVLTMASRSRAILAAASGDLSAARLELERTLALHERLGEPFERARTLLVLGGLERRDRKKRVAREALESALAVFDELGATLWAQRARAELARVSGRAPAGGLTPTEQRIAELIASGLTYRETADALFISPKTVQWNLSKVYRKLGIRSRRELGPRLGSVPRPPGHGAGQAGQDGR